MKILLSVLLTCSLTFASVKIYKNSAELTYSPTSTFIGFNQSMNASNENGNIKIIKGSCTNSKNNSLNRQKKKNSSGIDIKKTIAYISETMTKKTVKLQVTNMSNTTKKFEIYEKIPVSTDEDIKVKLEYFSELKDSKRLDTKMTHNRQNGKLSLHVELKAKEAKIFIYSYTIRHPKKIKIYINK